MTLDPVEREARKHLHELLDVVLDRWPEAEAKLDEVFEVVEEYGTPVLDVVLLSRRIAAMVRGGSG